MVLKIKGGKLCKVPRTVADILRHLKGKINTVLFSLWNKGGDDLKQSLLHITDGKVEGVVHSHPTVRTARPMLSPSFLLA